MVEWKSFRDVLKVDLDKVNIFEPLFFIDGEYLVKYRNKENQIKIGIARLLYRNIFNITNLGVSQNIEEEEKFEIKNRKLIPMEDIVKKSEIMKAEKLEEKEAELFIKEIEEFLIDAIEEENSYIEDNDAHKNNIKNLSKEKILNIEDLRNINKDNVNYIDDDFIEEVDIEELLNGPDYMYYLDFKEMEQDSNFEIIERYDDDKMFKFLLYFYKNIYTSEEFSVEDIIEISDIYEFIDDANIGNTPEESDDYIVELNYPYYNTLRSEIRVAKYIKECDKWVFKIGSAEFEKEDIVSYKSLSTIKNLI